MIYDSSVVIWSFLFSFKPWGPLGSSYRVGRVLSIGLLNSLSLTRIPFLISFLCFSGGEFLFLLI